MAAKKTTKTEDKPIERTPAEQAAITAFPAPPEGQPQHTRDPATDLPRGKTAERIFGKPEPQA